MIGTKINWVTTMRNAIMGGEFGWIKRWINDPKVGYDARNGLSEYKDFINGAKTKYIPFEATDFEIMQFNEYEKTS